MIEVLKSKIHRAIVTEANLNYKGSITIDYELMKKANIYEYEKVLVVDINNGNRLETYVIKGEEKSGVICLNGAAARKVSIGDRIIILSFQTIEIEKASNHIPKMVYVFDNNNNFKE